MSINSNVFTVIKHGNNTYIYTVIVYFGLFSFSPTSSAILAQPQAMREATFLLVAREATFFVSNKKTPSLPALGNGRKVAIF